MDEAQLDAFLSSGNERPAIWVLRAHRISVIAALLLFLVWMASAFGGLWAGAKDALFWVFAVVLLASLALKVAARRMDRRAMEKDMALLEKR